LFNKQLKEITMSNDPWGFSVERTDGGFENPNWGPDASLCAQSFLACTPKNVDWDDTFWWGNQLPDAPSNAAPKAVKSVTLPSVPYTGGTLNGSAGGSGWSASVVWSPSHTAAAAGTSYTATFTLTPTGKNYFDPENPPTVTVASSNGSGGIVSGAPVVNGNNEDGNVATVTVVVAYSAVVNKPVVTPPGQRRGWHGTILGSNGNVASINGQTFADETDPIFTNMTAFTPAAGNAWNPWTTKAVQDVESRPFWLTTGPAPTSLENPSFAGVNQIVAATIITVTIAGVLYNGLIFTNCVEDPSVLQVK
jgi:hypothetical protein